MSIDKDITEILTHIEAGYHSLDAAIGNFLLSLPGFEHQFHSSKTVQKYRSCLLDGKRALLGFLVQKNKTHVEDLLKEDIEMFKDELLNALDPQTVRPYITAIRLFVQYLFRMGWIPDDWSKSVKVPRVKKLEHIKVIPRQVVEEILSGEWGINLFAVARNALIVCLLLLRGLRPKEFPGITEADIHPYEDLAYVTVIGKRGVVRDVMLDPQTFQALRVYMIERAHYLYVNRISEPHIFLSLNPRNNQKCITTSGVQAVVRRIKYELRLRGIVWDLSAVNPQGCRRTAVSREYEKAEDSPLHHPEFTLSGQFGHSLTIAQKHYWRRSLRNAYRLIKKEAGQDSLNQDLPSNGADMRPKDIKDIFPGSSYFNNFGLDI
jgi:site-specific recombinase XerD